MTYAQSPLFDTQATWELPKELPNLAAAKMIGLDTETKDPQLLDKGPGVRRDGYMVGISVAVPEGPSWYLPFAHAEGKQFEKENIMRWAKDNLCNPNQPKVGANLLYDLDYFQHEGVEVTGPFYDVQNAEPLINENAKSYALDVIAQKYLGEKKRTDILADMCRDLGLKGKVQSHIWRFDPKYTGLYAEGDAEQPLQIFEKQKLILAEQGLEQVFDVETRLIPMLLHMRKIGVPVDVDKLMDFHQEIEAELETHAAELNDLAGYEINYNAASELAPLFDKGGYTYPLTGKSKEPSFTKAWLEKHDSYLADLIVQCREKDKIIATFLEGSFINMLVGDRIHCQFNQLRSDEFGTVTGRFSSSNPNLQNIPIRTEIGKRCRTLFIPDEGFGWCKADYSQIEVRLLIHYAMGRGAKEVVQAFNENPKMDYHQWCADMAHITRDDAKAINFGLFYGMGVPKLAANLGITLTEAKNFKKNYFVKLPFLQTTVNAAASQAEKKGYVHTILGRRRRFNLWESSDFKLSKKVKAHADKAVALEAIQKYVKDKKYGHHKKGLKRAGCYRAFNAADQGSAADIMKLALVDVWESGLCDVIKPYITVHDELDFGYPLTDLGRAAVLETRNIMQDTYKLKIPMVCDIETGPNWGNVKDGII